jgi:hypothetical protein
VTVKTGERQQVQLQDKQPLNDTTPQTASARLEHEIILAKHEDENATTSSWRRVVLRSTRQHR